ncbi:Taurine catabolism dioxygenase TauD TfdA [Gracilaria domingensis]|nr:Taurine catabolism dioxygenase TauD TfdA [Gracilaria domingensis]
MNVTEHHPFGVVVTGVDLASNDHLHQVRQLLWIHTVVILPSAAAQLQAECSSARLSLLKLGHLFGEPSHQAEANVQFSDSGAHVELDQSPAFSSTRSWRINPPIVNIWCPLHQSGTVKQICFRNTSKMFNGLPDETKEELYPATFLHSLDNRDDDRTTALHPAVIRHPKTGTPLLYVNKKYTRWSPSMSREDSDALLARVYSQVCDVETLTHQFKTDDIVLWDNFAVQYNAERIGTKPNVMYQTTPLLESLRLVRYAGEQTLEEALHLVVKLLQEDDNAGMYNEVSPCYDELSTNAGFICPEMGTQLLMKYLRMKESSHSNGPLILDVAAGTGRNAFLLLSKYGHDNIEALDASEGMLSEAKRRSLYKRYYVCNANEGLPLPRAKYDAAMCIGGLAPKQITPLPCIAEMVRVVKSGGFVVFSIQERNLNYVKAVKRLVDDQTVELVEKKEFIGMKIFPDIRHQVLVLQVM